MDVAMPHASSPSPARLTAVLFSLRGCLVHVDDDGAHPTPGALACLAQLADRSLPCLWLDAGASAEHSRLAAVLPQGLPRQVGASRPWPAPDACWQALMALGCEHLHGGVVVSAEPTLLQSALNAGLWTVGLAACTPPCARSARQWQGLSESAQVKARGEATLALYALGVHSVIDHLEALPLCLTDIAQRLAKGEKP